MTTVPVDPPASFARRYGLPIAFGVLVVAVIMGWRLWLDHQAKQPIVDPYKSFIEQLAAASPEARSELQRYLAASGRESVASQDFLPLCATMLRRARGVNASAISPGIAVLCDRVRQAP
jgi:predicted negative regulator of RcsB-dependent stress response